MTGAKNTHRHSAHWPEHMDTMAVLCAPLTPSTSFAGWTLSCSLYWAGLGGGKPVLISNMRVVHQGAHCLKMTAEGPSTARNILLHIGHLVAPHTCVGTCSQADGAAASGVLRMQAAAVPASGCARQPAATAQT